MAKNTKTILHQVFLDRVAWPALKAIISNLPEPERTEALNKSLKKLNL